MERIGTPFVKSEDMGIESIRFFDGGFKELAFVST
jgi:hypothetical protein